MPQIEEPARVTPVVDTSDVVVCGGGPAGIAAALAAAREGASVRLIESAGNLGGILTTGLLSWILDCGNKSGLMEELIDRLSAEGFGRRARGEHFIADTERVKLVLEEMAAEAGVKIRLYSSVVAADVDSEIGIRHVITESKSGREAWAGDVFVDCTGDGDLGYFAGCGFDKGHPETGKMQPMTLMMQVIGPDPQEVDTFDNTILRPDGRAKRKMREEMERAGLSPSYPRPPLFHIVDNHYILMTNHEYGVDGTDADDLTTATTNARRELHRIVDALRSLGGVWSDLRIIATGARIGVRETRRLHGLYTLTMDDLIRGARFDDGICRVKFGFDVHATSKETKSGFEHPPEKSRPYDIPLRSLIARDVPNMTMGGRCISGDFWAHSSYRVTGDAVVIGEAAGRVSALAAGRGVGPAEVDPALVVARAAKG
jgi:hypothetical protein